MSRPTQLLILLLECTVVTVIVLTLLPHVAVRNRLLASEWSIARRAQASQVAAERNAVAVEETTRALEQALSELRGYGVEARNLNQVPQELSTLATQVGLRLDRFQHLPAQPVYAGTQEIGRRAAVAVVLVGEYAALLQLLERQRERLPGLKMERMLIRRSSGVDVNGLIVNITFSTQLFPEPKPVSVVPTQAP